MARGGARSGAGRRKGQVNRVTAAQREAAAASGEMPIDYMLRVMRARDVDDERRDDMAKAVAPYLHPRLANVEHKGKGGGPIKVEFIQYSDKAVR